jgi:hypothetical protein
MTAKVYKFPLCCRRRMIYQPARLRWYCKTCGKLMPHREEFTPPPPAFSDAQYSATIAMTDTPIW